MPITLNCPKCHKPFRVRDESIGGRVRCPSCGSELQVPSALSPASNFDEAPKNDQLTSTSRPMADDVRGGAIPEVRLGDPGRRDEMVNLGSSTGTSFPGPPSIKARFPVAPSQSLPPRMIERVSAPKNLPKTPPEPKRPTLKSLSSQTSEQASWSKVGSGLRMIRCALFLCTLVILAVFGHGVWIMFDYDRAMSNNMGLLKKEGWPLWKEVMVAYIAGPLIPAALLMLFGRLRCNAAPAEANARGLAFGAMFFTLVALAGSGLFLGIEFFDLAGKLKLPEQARLTSLFAAIPSAILADVLTLLFIGQIGWPIKRPSLQKSVAGFFVYAAILPAAVLIGMLWYPVIPAMHESFRETGSPFGADESDLAQRALIWSVLLLMGVVMLFLRYAGVAGSARRGIRKMLEG